MGYANGPVTTPVLFNPMAPLGSAKRWTALADSGVPRLYHSCALLLKSGEVHGHLSVRLSIRTSVPPSIRPLDQHQGSSGPAMQQRNGTASCCDALRLAGRLSVCLCSHVSSHQPIHVLG
jgi:hypothetical protein